MNRDEWLKRRAGYRAFGIDKVEPEDINTEAKAEDVDDVTVEPIEDEAKAEDDLPVID